MIHLLISREYPPCTYPMGGIGAYVRRIARLLAERGETVHVIAERWQGAPLAREVLVDGRLTVHRVWTSRPIGDSRTPHADADLLEAMAASPFPAQAFSWQAAMLAERLVESERVDVIEAQDYEAPLYYFLVRRALGAGPSRRPPCFVHLHTTHEQVCRANGWSIDTPQARLMKTHEDDAIRAADALLAPSRFLARETERSGGLPTGSIVTMPYPIGDVPLVERTIDTWTTGTICFVGRYEARKGLLEWVPAAIDVASRRPGLRFEFIGADTPLAENDAGSSVRSTLQSLVPAHLRRAFVFSGPVDQPLLWRRLGAARIAVVPSRWENFPNTCVEAMCSGLPVLATPNGGMAEMVQDGVTGWVASSNTPADLALTLARALTTTPDAVAEMGRRASESIRAQCDNARTVDAQLEFRRALVRRGPGRSMAAPAGTRPTLPTPDSIATGLADEAATKRSGSPRWTMIRRVARSARQALSSPVYTANWLLWQGWRFLRRVRR
ncbi:MAG: glycosyltransferase family 4 protein [Acidobacteriota bacterium]